MKRLAWVVVVIVFLLPIGIYVWWSMESRKNFASIQVASYALDSQRRVEIVENIRRGELDEALGLLESRIYQDKDYLTDHSTDADGDHVDIVNDALDRIAKYQEQFPWQP